MRTVLLVIVICCALACVSCSDGKAKELYETATLEELQHNPQHARELYRKVIDSYPGSDYAYKARERLSLLQGKD